ncbi:MAG: hypothetical protein JNL11_00145 [Bdellovibrionaceae bacterium]|nr:hypothetical protein [Pseudobdellovibrionaceae bacterium]
MLLRKRFPSCILFARAAAADSLLTDSKLAESFSDAQVINEAIQSLVKTKFIKIE